MKSVRQIEEVYISETWFKFQRLEGKCILDLDFSE